MPGQELAGDTRSPAILCYHTVGARFNVACESPGLRFLFFQSAHSISLAPAATYEAVPARPAPQGHTTWSGTPALKRKNNIASARAHEECENFASSPGSALPPRWSARWSFSDRAPSYKDVRSAARLFCARWAGAVGQLDKRNSLVPRFLTKRSHLWRRSCQAVGARNAGEKFPHIPVGVGFPARRDAPSQPAGRRDDDVPSPTHSLSPRRRAIPRSAPPPG